jgi:non-ribosomal peptide synthase protein (TIGR01720 family)
LLTAHHLVVDAVSWQILLNDFTLLYDQIKLGKNLQLPKKTHSYQVWADHFQDYSKQVIRRELSYWEGIITSSENAASLWMDNYSGSETFENHHTVQTLLSTEETQQLLTTAQEAYRTDANDLLVLALGLAVRKMTNRSDVILELEGHGREEIFRDIDITRTVGWFTSIYPIHLNLVGNDMEELIKAVKEQIRGIPNKGIGYSILRYINRIFPNPPIQNVRFNYLGRLDNSFKNHLFQLSQEDSGADHAPENRLTCLLDIVAAVIDDRLKISITYNRNQFKDTTITVFLDQFMETLRELIRHCLYEAKQQFTPSDFDAAVLSQVDLEILFD